MRHVEVVTLTPARLLLVLITSTGRVEQRVVELANALDDETVGDLRARLNTAVVGQPLTDAADAGGVAAGGVPPRRQGRP